MTPMQEALKLYMSIKGTTARGMQRGLGIDHTAISRFVSGKDISLDNFAILLTWFISKPNNPPEAEGIRSSDKFSSEHSASSELAQPTSSRKGTK